MQTKSGFLIEYYGKDGRRFGAIYATLEEAKRVAQDIFSATGIIVGITAAS